MITPRNHAQLADRALANIQKMLPQHPRAETVIYFESVLAKPPAAGDGDVTGNLDYLSEQVELKDPVVIKMLEVKADKSSLISAMGDFGYFVSDEYEEPIAVLLEPKTVPERSVIIRKELVASEDLEKRYMVLRGEGIGRNGQAGFKYYLVPFRGVTDEDIEEIEAEPPAKTDSDSLVWGVDN